MDKFSNMAAPSRPPKDMASTHADGQQESPLAGPRCDSNSRAVSK
jgi:hypothetical protein